MVRLPILLLLLLPFPLLADSWCLQRDATENCRFNTADECYAVATSQGGNCAPNPRKLGELGNSPYCVLTDSYRQCTYRSRTICLRVAQEVNGGCVRNVQLDLERRASGQMRAMDSLVEDLGALRPE